MKRTFIAVALVATMGLAFASCTNKAKCWKVEAKQTVSVEGESDAMITTFYVWSTEDELDATIKASSIGISVGDVGGVSTTYTKIPADEFKTEQDCMANPPQMNM